MHDAYKIGIPVLVILIANLINRSEIKDLRTEMNARFDKMQADITSRFDKVEKRFDPIEAELRYLHGVTGKLDGWLSSLEKR